MNTNKIALTGDRPTGKLHLGHYVGSLENRIAMQDTYDLTVLVADAQALTDNARDPQKVRNSIIEVMADYIGVGIDPAKARIALQSAIPELYELTVLYQNLISVNRLQHIPTIKSEIKMRGFEESVPYGFLGYPVAQAADITIFKAEVVPVGEDQLPLVEVSNEIVRKVNDMAGAGILPASKALLSDFARLPGTDGRKASKSLGNAIYLSDSDDEIKQKVMAMFTDPDHLKVTDPGKVEGNVVFAYLQAFYNDRKHLAELEEHYKQGGLGDMVLKRLLIDILTALIAPIRSQREQAFADKAALLAILREGTAAAREDAGKNLREIRKALGVPAMF